MRFRKIRIAWSVICGIACVLLIVLWVRSIWRSDSMISTPGPSAPGFRTTIFNGYIELDHTTYFAGPARTEWRLAAPSDHAPILWPHTTRGGFVFGSQFLVAPLWLPLIVTGTIAAAPWIRWSNRFTLRTLLIATTLVAVVLGLVVWAARR